MGDYILDKKKMLEKIKRSEGIQHILNESQKIMNNPMLIFDMEYKLVAYPENAVTDDPIWNEFMEYGKLGQSTIEFFKNENFIDAVASSTGITYLISDKLKYDRIFGQIYNKNNMPILDLIVMECYSTFDENALELVETLCQIFSEEFSKNDFYQNYGQEYQDLIIKELVEENIVDRVIYSGHIANIYNGLKSNIFVGVIDILNYSNLVYFRELFCQIQPEYKYSIYSNYIIALISSENDTLNINEDFNHLNILFQQEEIYMGVSKYFDNLYNMHIYYNEALIALKNGMENKDDLYIFL